MIKIKGGITAPKDFKASALNCGIKRRKKDLALIFSSVPAVGCGLFTQNRVKAAPIFVDKEHLKKTTAQAIIVNSGNANCCTGKRGLRDAHLMAELTARELGLSKRDVLVASTGVIGKELPIERIRQAIPDLVSNLSRERSHDVAEAIMTTDKVVKQLAFKIKIKGKDVILGGIAKGAGMIYPNMATMLCFITTDVYITRRALKRALSEAVNSSFNSISVDGDMSTNDSALALANGSSGNRLLDKNDKDFKIFANALNCLTGHLAKAIVKDGEGSTKFVQINVENAKTTIGARRVARKIATSTLFKAALFGEDPNWGRIVASVGASGVVFDPGKLEIFLGKVKVLKGTLGSSRNKKLKLKRFFKNRDLDITVKLNNGKKSYTMWTCDLSSEYIKINAHYTT